MGSLLIMQRCGPQGPDCPSITSHSQDVDERPHYWGEKIKPGGEGDFV